MASIAQIQANRINAQKSTGPCTAQGKAAVARNAVKHGLLAEQVVIQGEDPGEFEFYREAMLGELSPAGEVESMLAERAVGLAWRLRRAERLQSEVFGTLLAKVASANHMKKMTRAMIPQKMREGMNAADEGQTALGQAVVRDYANYRVLDRLGLYEQRIERSLYKTMAELERVRMLRNAVGTPGAKDCENHNGDGRRQKSESVGCALHTAGEVKRAESIESVCSAHPTVVTQGNSKSEARNSKSETNTNDRKVNDTNEIAPACGSVKVEGLGDGEEGSGQSAWEMTQTSTTGAGRFDSAKQSQFAGDTQSREGVGRREGHLG